MLRMLLQGQDKDLLFFLTEQHQFSVVEFDSVKGASLLCCMQPKRSTPLRDTDREQSYSVLIHFTGSLFRRASKRGYFCKIQLFSHQVIDVTALAAHSCVG